MLMLHVKKIMLVKSKSKINSKTSQKMTNMKSLEVLTSDSVTNKVYLREFL